MTETEHEPEAAAPACYWFDGILDGPRDGDDVALRDRLARVNAVGMVDLQLELDAGRFNLLADDRVRAGSAPLGERAERFLAALDDLVAGAGADGPIESTLRCTTVHDGRVHETLFAVHQGRVRPVTRERALTAEDRAHIAGPDDGHMREPVVPLGGRLLAIVAALLLIAGGLVVWQTGMIDRAMAASVEDLDQRLGDFQGMLGVTSTSEFGRYEVEIARGPTYPAEAKAVDRLVADAETTARRAAVTAVADGSTVYIRVEDAEGTVVAAQPASLRALVTDPDGTVTIHVPGHRRAAAIVVALDHGMPDR